MKSVIYAIPASRKLIWLLIEWSHSSAALPFTVELPQSTWINNLALRKSVRQQKFAHASRSTSLTTMPQPSSQSVEAHLQCRESASQCTMTTLVMEKMKIFRSLLCSKLQMLSIKHGSILSKICTICKPPNMRLLSRISLNLNADTTEFQSRSGTTQVQL